VTSNPEGLKGKAVVVTGAGQGLGRAYAEHLAALGASVVVAEVLAERGAATAAAIEKDGGTALAVQTDVTEPDSVDGMIAATLREFGRLDGLVNNAAIYDGLRPVPAAGLSRERWSRVMDVNVWGTLLCARAAHAVMASRGGGRIVNVSSTSALLGVPMMADYVASKGAVVALTRSLAREWGADDVTVNAVAPGGTWTEAAQHLFGAGGGAPPDPEQARAGAIAQQAIKRQEYPGDVVGTIAFLLGDAAAMITGQLIVVDGGMALH
jgi:3-oxoacyl-[acyl-carrier protein] reductase